MDSITKKCSQCGNVFYISEFSKDINIKNGHKAACKNCCKKKDLLYRLSHKKEISEYNKNWYKGNPSKKKEYDLVRRARIFQNGGRILSSEWNELCKKFGEKCLCCGEVKKLTLDHVIPLALGGKNVIENSQPLCMQCNQRKGIKIIDYRK